MAVLSSDEKCALRELGWVKLASDARNETVLASRTLMLAEDLGTPVRGRLPQLIEALMPKVPEEAKRHSAVGVVGECVAGTYLGRSRASVYPGLDRS